MRVKVRGLGWDGTVGWWRVGMGDGGNWHGRSE